MLATNSGLASLDTTYLEELRGRGIEIDHTEKLDEVTLDRLRAYNAVIVHETPDAFAVRAAVNPRPPERDATFRATLEDFISLGGGVLLMPAETNLRKQRVSSLSDRWGAQIPAERIVETSADLRSALPHGGYQVELAYTSNVAKSPITKGVRGIWYANRPAYLASFTMPLVVDDTWEVLVRGSPTAVTQPVDLASAIDAAPGLLQRKDPERAPALVAVRSLGIGRVAMVAEWAEFSLAAGTKWIYDRVVLERGQRGRVSDFGRLLENLLWWLSEPSLRSGKVGGWVSAGPPVPPNQSDAVRRSFHAASVPSYPRAQMMGARERGERVYKGLIGARTGLTTGHGTVAQYARAARSAGLDFLVFLEPLHELTEEKLRILEQECTAHSGSDLLLLPGFWASSNIGNRLFFFAPHPSYPPPNVLTGPDQRTLYIQAQNGAGAFTGSNTPYLTWILNSYHQAQGQVGYFDFRGAPKGVRLHDARLYSMAAVQHYQSGRLKEDLLDDYLLTAAGTIPPTPVALHEVTSPLDLVRQVSEQRGLTYVVASSLVVEDANGVYRRGLRWKHMYDAMPTYSSTGPSITTWPTCFRATSYGAEGFAPERSLLFAPVEVHSEVGLRELSIYDGNRLFRRISTKGAKDYRTELVLDGSLQRTLVLVASDVRGGIAVSSALRMWTEGAAAPVFCSDYINDCGRMLLAHGPWSLRMNDPPALPESVAGTTWDGGPQAHVSALGTQNTMMEVSTSAGMFSSARLDAIPLLDFSDEGATGVSAWRREQFDASLESISNPWHTNGPIAMEPPLFEHMQSYREWLPRSEGAPPFGWAGAGVRAGGNASLFRSSLKFLRAAEVRSIRVATFERRSEAVLAVLRHGGSSTVVDLSGPTQDIIDVAPGEAIGVFGKRAMNAHLLTNRSGPLQIRIRDTVELFARTSERTIAAGESFTFEVAALGLSIRSPVTQAAGLKALFEYLDSPEAVRVLRGSRLPSPGLIDVLPSLGAVELRADRMPFEGVLPVRVRDLNPRWSAGLLQQEGFLSDFYGPPQNRYRGLGVDAEGSAFVPVDASRSGSQVLAGHPVVAGEGGRDIFIQVTCLGGSPMRWHVSANNPTSHVIRTTISQAMDLPGLKLTARTVALQPGELMVLQ